MYQNYDRVIRGTEKEDERVILQFMKGMIGQKFAFLNYYKEVPISYEAVLLNVENDMAEFSIHENQAKVINLEKMTLIHSHPRSTVSEDMTGEAFYVNSAKKCVILCNFGYSRICSSMRRYVRVHQDRNVDAELIFEGDLLKGNVRDISLGGVALRISSVDHLVPGLDIKLSLKLPDTNGKSLMEVAISATILKIIGTEAPYTCIIELHEEKHSQQQIAYYINLRQVEIIKELKDLIE